MKKLLSLLFAVLLFASCSEPTFSEEAEKMRVDENEMFRLISKTVAKDWSGDHNMMVKGINAQVLACHEYMEIQSRYDFNNSLMTEMYKKHVTPSLDSIVNFGAEPLTIDFVKIVSGYRSEF